MIKKTKTVARAELELELDGRRTKRRHVVAGGKRHKITIHSMRAFFHTQASIVHDEQYANAMDGHQGYLMQYYRLSAEKRSEMYLALEPHLLIYANESVVKSHEKLREQTELQRIEIEKLKKMVDRMQKYLPKTV